MPLGFQLVNREKTRMPGHKSFLVSGRVEQERSRSIYAIGYLLPSQKEPEFLSEQNVRERGISTEICVKSREKSSGFPTLSRSFLNPNTVLPSAMGSTSGPFCLCSFSVLHSYQTGEKRKLSETPENRKPQLARENARKRCSPSPAANMLRCS